MLFMIFLLSLTLSAFCSPIYSDQPIPMIIEIPTDDIRSMANVKRQLKAFAEPTNTRKLNAMSMMRALINLRRY
ncbi:unnamed protein product [Bursaphelenchus okinawaensis]|uniref:Uncharacterized protein n=1 Tax=Bursaphelenchus okinawaensis TaxID=465554 RepID=A0A811K2N4_9BILA|nr:unnamed protein product [Bursaphelenchus okinawaensis]CAG9090641.1 unnamed protein product [Bursaphelenchus okinawaensis]